MAEFLLDTIGAPGAEEQAVPGGGFLLDTLGPAAPAPEVAVTPAEAPPAEAPPTPPAEAPQAMSESLVEGLIWVESRNNPNAVSRVGALGPAQIMPDTAKDPGFGVEPVTDPRDPEQSRRFVRQYLGAMIDRYGNLEDALRAYNWGVGNVDDWIAGGRTGPIPQETVDYVTGVQVRMAELDAAPAQLPPQPGVNTRALAETTVGVNPEVEAENRRVAEALGVSRDTVAADPEAARQHRFRGDVLNALEEAPPVTRSILANPDTLALAHDDIESLSTFENLAAGMSQRVLQAAAGMNRVIAGVVDTFLSSPLLPGYIEYDFSGRGPLVQWRRPTPEDRKRSNLLRTHARHLEMVAGYVNYQPGTTWEDVKGDPLVEFIPFAIEQGIVSVPDMALVLANLPAYVAARTGEIGQTRAINNGKTDATIGDFFAAAPAAIASAALERMGTKGILGIDDALKAVGPRAVAAAAGRGAVKEAATEAGQEFIETAGETLGTEPGFNLAEAFDRAMAGAVAGAGFGGVVRAGTASVQSIRAAADMRRAATRMNEEAAKSALQRRAPDVAAQHRAEALRAQGIEEVIVKATDAIDAAETTPNPSATLADMGVALQIDAVLDADGDVRIPVDNYARVILATNMHKVLADNMRFSEDALTVEAAVGQMAQISGDMIQAMEANTAIDAGTKAKVGELLENLETAKPVDAADAILKASSKVRATLDRLVNDVDRSNAEAQTAAEKGRVRELDRQITSLDRQIEEQSALIDQREAEGKPVVAANKKLDRLIGQRDALDAEAAQITLPRGPTEPAPKLTAKTVTTTGGVLERLGVRTTTESIRSIRKGFREGVKAAKTDVAQSQTLISQLIQQSPLTAQDKAKFLTTIKNIQTTEQAQRRLPTIQSRITRLVEKQRRRELTSALKAVLKKTKPRVVAGKPVGKFDADTQAVLDMARETLAMSADAAALKLEENLDQDMPSLEAALENRLLAVAAGDENLSNDDLEQLVADLEGIKEEGRNAARDRLLRRIRRKERALTEASEAVTTGKSVAAIKTSGIVGRALRNLREAGAEFASWHNGYDEVLDIIFNKKGVNAADLIRRLEVTRELQLVKKRMIRWQGMADEAGIKALGLQNQKELVRKHYEDAKRQDLGEFVNARGETVRLEYSVAEARKLWMELQDETIADAIADERGNAYTDEMLLAIDGLLSEGDKHYAQAQLDIYRRLYPEVNAVYRRVYGVDLPFNETYSPIQRDRGAVPLEESAGVGADRPLLEEHKYRRALPKSLKSRQANLYPIKRRSDIGAMHRYMHDMANFVEMQEKAIFLNDVFGNVRLRKEISEFHGTATMAQIDAYVKDFGTGYPQRGQFAEALFGAFNRNFSKSVLALKPTIGAKQLMSFGAYAENVPAATFIKGMVDFARNPKKAIDTLYGSSPLLQERGSSLDFELAKIGSDREPTVRWRHSQKFDDLMFMFIRYGDRAPIYAGGWSLYKYRLSQGDTHQQAIEAFEAVTAATQQSTDLDKLSALQSGGSLGRFMTMFMTARIALLRGELRAARQFRRKKIGVREFGKRMAIYHFVIPSLIQFVASGLRFEEDRQLLALVLGQLNNFVIFGDMVATAAQYLLTDDRFEVDSNLPLVEVFNEAWRGAQTLIEEGVDTESVLEALADWGDAAGKLTGKPIEQLRHIIIGGAKIADEDVAEGGRLILGYSPTIAEQASK